MCMSADQCSAGCMDAWIADKFCDSVSCLLLSWDVVKGDKRCCCRVCVAYYRFVGDPFNVVILLCAISIKASFVLFIYIYIYVDGRHGEQLHQTDT